MKHSSRREFIRQIGLGAVGAGLVAGLPANVGAVAVSKSLPRGIPEQQGISSAGISSFLDAIAGGNIEFHSLMIARHGVVIAEGWWAPYAPKLKHTLYSLSKSFTSTAVGLAQAQGLLSIEAPVVSFFPKDLPQPVSANLAAMKVKHLLMMGTGHAKDTINSLRGQPNDNWAKTFLSIPVEFEPGTHFVYNTGATYMLSAIVQKVSGMKVVDYLKPRLFDPLGIENYDWETNSQGINVGGYGLRVTTEDITKLGLLYLQKGKWNGKQLLPEKWAVEATTAHIDNTPAVPRRPKEVDDWSQGYGYQFWRCTHGGYRGDGAFGQFCLVLPDKDVVVAITSESFDLQGSLNLVWSYLLPAINDSALQPDAPGRDSLVASLKSLALNPPKGNGTSPNSPTISGSTYALDANDFNAKSVSFELSEKGCLFTLKDDKGSHAANCGWAKWIETPNAKTQVLFPMAGRPEVDTPLAASAVWTDPTTLTITLRYIATAHSDNLICKFDGRSVRIEFQNSIAKGNPEATEKRMPLHGLAT